MNYKYSISIISVIIAFIMALAVNGTIQTEYEKKPHVQEQFAEKDYDYLYNFYVNTRPNLEGRPAYGDQEAPIVLILYTDFTSTGAQAFNEVILPELLGEFVHAGDAKLYYKHYLLLEDYQAKNEQYYYAQAIECYASIQGNTLYDFIFALYNTSLVDVPELAESQGLDRQEFMACIKAQTFKNIVEDVAEVQQFGMVGISPRLYMGIEGQAYQSMDGVPNYDQIHRRIRNYQVRFGD